MTPSWMLKHKLARSLLPALLLAACGDGGSTAARDAGSDSADATDDVDAGHEPAPDEDASSLDGAEPEADADATAPGIATIQFKGRVGSHEYGCDRTYPGQGSAGTDVTGRAFRFFVYDVRLLDASGAETPFALESRLPAQTEDVALVDFQDPEGSCGDGMPTNTRLTGQAPAGDYRGIVFRVGLPEALNHGDPALATQPLRGSGMAWNWLQGYRFFVGELASVNPSDASVPPPSDAGTVNDAGAVADTGPDDPGGGAHDFEPGLGMLHIGSTGCLGSPARGIACDKSNRPEIRLANFDPAANTVVVDLGALFATADLTTGLQCHGRGEACASMFRALGVDLASGEVLPAQTVFRVE